MNHSEYSLQILRQQNAILVDTHVIYTSGRHGDAYINKDAVYPNTLAISTLCQSLAQHFFDSGIQVVAAPAIGGVILSQWTAHHLSSPESPVLSVYAEKDSGGFIFRRGYDSLIRGKRTLIVEDVITTGSSVRDVVAAARLAGAEVVGVGALCNRGGIDEYHIGEVPELYCLTEISLSSWEAADCPLCLSGVPINTDVGKGREYLARFKPIVSDP